jgi:hypothetical protein
MYRTEGANSAARPCPGYGVNKMKRRDFMRIFLLGIILAVSGKKVKAEIKSETKPKEAMFWRKLD